MSNPPEEYYTMLPGDDVAVQNVNNLNPYGPFIVVVGSDFGSVIAKSVLDDPVFSQFRDALALIMPFNLRPTVTF